MKTLKFISLAIIVLSLFSCQKDPMEDIKSGDWNKERNILSIKLQNQIGPATIVRNENEQKVTAYVGTEGINYSAVKIESLVLSYKATSDIKEQGTLNFNNAEYKSQLTVKSQTGADLTWDIYILPYEWFYLKTWGIKEQRIFVDQEWGSKFDRNIVDISANFSPEMDNEVEWVLDGFRNGKPYGRLINKAGTDGLYGSYKISDDVNLDLRLRHLLPAGESIWEIDLATNQVSIIKGSTVSVAKLTKEAFGIRLDFTLPYKNPYQPRWDYGAWDNYMAWSYRFVIDLELK